MEDGNEAGLVGFRIRYRGGGRSSVCRPDRRCSGAGFVGAEERGRTMDYCPLTFEQYFIDNSADYNHTGATRREIAYKSASYRCGRVEKFLGLQHEVNYEIFYETERDVIQLNFERSVGLGDWVANVVEFSSRYYDSIEYRGEELQLRAHHGWAEMYRAIKHEVRSAWSELHRLHPCAHTEIIGWSLGSGQAILCAQDLNYNFGVKAYLYTFGTVRPFRYTRKNRMLTEQYLSELCAECYNFANVNDIVTYLPPFYGFTMPRRVNVGTEKRTLRGLMNPLYFHTSYDNPRLYRKSVLRKRKTADSGSN